MSKPAVVRIERIGLTVADLASTCAFYEQGLGFRRVGTETRAGRAFAELMGVEGVRAEVVVLRLGDQEIELAAFTPPGLPYPCERGAADPWFQHFAVVTADMDAAYAAVGRAGAAAISKGGPQLLPPATGSIKAYKFRDPEGHPLELSWFPKGVGAPAWRDPPPGAVFLGIDHSAIAVTDADASAAFYTERLGMSLAARQVNSGPTQDRLDGFADAQVDIVTLQAGAGPHLELLAYRQPKRADVPSLRANDVAATRLILHVTALAELLDRLADAGGALISQRLVTLQDGSKAALVRDPDGHLLQLHEVD